MKALPAPAVPVVTASRTPAVSSEPRPASSRKSRLRWVAFALLILAAPLFVARLGTPLFWQDEAMTALIARTVLTHGVPLGTDGRNSFSQEAGAECGPDDVYRWTPWFPFYLLAGFFALLGEGTFVGRLPFAMFGLGTVAAAMLLARELWGTRRAALLAGGLLALNVPFIILSRQCRYYSPAAFFSVLALLAYRGNLRSRRSAPFFFVVGGALLFHTHPLYFFALLIAVLSDAAVEHRDRFWKTVGWSAVATALAVPWLVWLGELPYGKRYGVSSPRAVAGFFQSFLSQLVRWVVPWPFLLLGFGFGAAMLTIRKGSLRRLLSAGLLPVTFMAATLVGLSVRAFWPFFRYLTPVIPMCAILAAGIIDAVTSWKLAAGLALAASALIGQPYGKFAYEFTHRFRGPVEALVSFLRGNARPGDVVAITYGDMPLKFYTPLRVIGGLTGEDLGPAGNADWIVIRQYQITDEDERVAEYLKSHVPWWKYRRIVLDGPDTPWENRESPQEHLYETASQERPVVIYKRVVP